MKSRLCFSFLSVSILSLIVFFSCRKSNNQETEPTVEPDKNGGTVKPQSTGCTPPDYGDSIIYTRYKGPNNDFTIKPKNDTTGGTFIFSPVGLVIDTATGTINVTQSETGVRYNIGWVKHGTTDTCFTQLILAGVTYVDSIYVLEKNDTLAIPYYNANPLAPPVCDNSDDSDYPGPGTGQGNNRCQFDVDPPPGNKANDQNVRVRTISGVINLKKTLQDGAFGANPQNGASKTVSVYYRLNDNSGRALQKISVQLMYYNSVRDIPQALVSDIATKRKNFFEYRVVNERPRPPLLIITRYVQ
jgi:hypothetical protein